MYKIKGDKRDELPFRISAAVARKKKRECQTRRSIRFLGVPDVKCIEVEGGIFEKCILNCKKFVISV